MDSETVVDVVGYKNWATKVRLDDLIRTRLWIQNFSKSRQRCVICNVDLSKLLVMCYVIFGINDLEGRACITILF
jgi:hypothetical protein